MYSSEVIAGLNHEQNPDSGAIFRALSDPARLRAFQFLREEPLMAGEVAELLGAGQSTASTLLRILKEAGLVLVRADGRRAWYRLARVPAWVQEAVPPLHEADSEALQRVVGQRAQEGGARYQIGRSWEGLARTLLLGSDLGKVADFGVGTGELSRLLAASAERLYAIDRSAGALAALVEQGLPIVAIEAEIERVTLPEKVDLVVISQTLHHLQQPALALQRALVALKKRGRLWVMELERHAQETGHPWPGFTIEMLQSLLQEAGFVEIKVRPSGRDSRGFTILSAVGVKP